MPSVATGMYKDESQTFVAQTQIFIPASFSPSLARFMIRLLTYPCRYTSIGSPSPALGRSKEPICPINGMMVGNPSSLMKEACRTSEELTMVWMRERS